MVHFQLRPFFSAANKYICTKCSQRSMKGRLGCHRRPRERGSPPVWVFSKQWAISSLQTQIICRGCHSPSCRDISVTHSSMSDTPSLYDIIIGSCTTHHSTTVHTPLANRQFRVPLRERLWRRIAHKEGPRVQQQTASQSSLRGQRCFHRFSIFAARHSRHGQRNGPNLINKQMLSWTSLARNIQGFAKTVS